MRHADPSSTEVAGVILAGGRSRRMGGGDKGLLDLCGRSLLAHVIGRLAPQVGAMVLNTNGDPARFESLGLPVAPDSLPGRPGPLAGVLAGLDWAHAEGYHQIVTAAGDTPFLPPDLVARLSAAAPGRPVVLAASSDGALHPVFGLWSVELRKALRADIASGARRVGDWAMARGAVPVMFEDAAGDPFFNVNTPEDLAEARARAARRA